ncbi:hypothetical protein ACFX2I_039799 [Malus domestica]
MLRKYHASHRVCTFLSSSNPFHHYSFLQSLCSRLAHSNVKGAGRLYKDEKAVRQWIFSSFIYVKLAMRTTEDQWSILNAFGNVRVLSLSQEFSDSIKLDFGRLPWDLELIKLIFFGGFSLVFFHLSEAKLVQPVLIHERL